MQTLCVTGPLGAGKTTTLVRLLAASDKAVLDGLRLVVNEVGDFQVDVERLREDLGSTIDIDSLTAGCLGCENAAEFDEIVGSLATENGLLAIEPTGVADAREIKAITDRHHLPWACLTLVNPETFRRNQMEGMLAAQLSVATMVGITWLDGLDDELEQELMAYIGHHASGVPIVRLEAEGALSFDTDAVLADETSGDHHHHPDDHLHLGHDHHDHDHGAHGHFTMAFPLRSEVSLERLYAAMEPIRGSIVRAKGVVAGRRFDLVGPRVKTGVDSAAEPHVVVIASTMFSTVIFADVRADAEELPDKKRLMVEGEGSLDEVIEAIKHHAAAYPEPMDGAGFPKLGAESDIAGWLARKPGVPMEYKQLAMTARMRFLLSVMEVLHQAEQAGKYEGSPSRLARERLELGAALAWNAGERAEEVTPELIEAIASVKPAHLAVCGLRTLSSLSLDLLPDDAQGPTTPAAITAIVRFGLEREELDKEVALISIRHAAKLAEHSEVWHQRWHDAITSVEAM